LEEYCKEDVEKVNTETQNTALCRAGLQISAKVVQLSYSNVELNNGILQHSLSSEEFFCVVYNIC
jgi:hypothetical protein